MSTLHHVPANEWHGHALAPTTRLGGWGMWLAVVSLVGFAMVVVMANFGADDPATGTFWGVFGLLGPILWVPFALAALIVGLLARFRRGERALLAKLAYLPFLIILSVPFIFPDA